MSSSLIKQIADRLNLPPDDVDVAVREWTNALRNQVSQEGQATLPGFGVFQQQGQHLTFEPEETLSEAINYRFSGLQTVVIEASPAYATDEVATDEVATDEVATDEVATDEVATDEVVVPPFPATGFPSFEDQSPPLEQRPTEEASLSTELRTSRLRDSETTPLDDARDIVQEHGGLPEELTAEDDALHAPDDDMLAASPLTEDAGGATEPSRPAFAEEAPELSVQDQAAETDITATPGWEDAPLSEVAAPDLRHENRPLPREGEPVPPSQPRVPMGARDRRPISPEEKTSPWPRILIAVLALVIVGSVIVFYVLNQRNPDQPPPAQQQAQRAPVLPQPSEREDSASVAIAEPDSATVSQTTPPTRSTEPPPPDTASTTGIDYAAGGYTLVIASDTRSTAAVSVAQQYATRFREQAYPVEIISGTTDGVARYRVAVGQFQTPEEADATRRRLANELPEGTWVMALPSSSP